MHNPGYFCLPGLKPRSCVLLLNGVECTYILNYSFGRHACVLYSNWGRDMVAIRREAVLNTSGNKRARCIERLTTKTTCNNKKGREERGSNTKAESSGQTDTVQSVCLQTSEPIIVLTSRRLENSSHMLTTCSGVPLEPLLRWWFLELSIILTRDQQDGVADCWPRA